MGCDSLPFAAFEPLLALWRLRPVASGCARSAPLVLHPSGRDSWQPAGESPRRQELDGCAWSGSGAIEAVDVSDDGGESYSRARRAGGARPVGLVALDFGWDAGPGEYTLACRARGAAGDVQPLEPEWNLGGCANNPLSECP